MKHFLLAAVAILAIGIGVSTSQIVVPPADTINCAYNASPNGYVTGSVLRVQCNAYGGLLFGGGGGGGPVIDGSTTIVTGATAQNLFGGAIAPSGWTVINPDPSEDCWASDTTTATPNGVGSLRLAANGGGYETPPFRKGKAAVSVVCATTGHKLTASMW